MLAETLRYHFMKTMGTAIDLVRLSDVGERQLRQFSTTFRDTFNNNMVQLLSSLEKDGVIRKCECLQRVLAAKKTKIGPEEMNGVYLTKSTCAICKGSGYVDCFKTNSPGQNK